jgi:hypothetical protein
MALSDEACPQLLWKSLDAGIGQLLAPYAPAATRATISKTTIKQYTHFAGRFDGHRNAAVQYRTYHPIEMVLGYNGSHWFPPLGKYCGQ